MRRPEGRGGRKEAKEREGDMGTRSGRGKGRQKRSKGEGGIYGAKKVGEGRGERKLLSGLLPI